MLPTSPHGGTGSLLVPVWPLTVLPWGSAGFISMLSVSNPVLRLPLGCLRTCWIELSLQRELNFALLQELRFGSLFGYLLDPCLLPFRRQTHFRGSLGSSFGSR